MITETGFSGAKAAFFFGSRVLTLQRDDLEGLPWRGQWDLPGGGREGDESPEDCLLRELHEEFGLRFPPERLIWKRALPAAMDASRYAYFFAGRIREDEIAQIRFGLEGQGWQMMEAAGFLAHPQAIAAMKERLSMAMRALQLSV